MVFITFSFYCFVLALLLVYYSFPCRHRWTVLLAGSLGFYVWLCPEGLLHLGWAVAVSYGAGLLLSRLQENHRSRAARLWVLWTGIFLVLAPLLLVKEGDFVLSLAGSRDGSLLSRILSYREGGSIFIPLGISFYSLQIIAYLTDLYRGKISCQKSLPRYALFVTFFPQIVQGPIPRYENMAQLYEGHRFDETRFIKGFHLILWGFFLKLILADRLAPAVTTVFSDVHTYAGWYILIAGLLYSIQLYTDFQACVCLSRGTAMLFGIRLEKNFLQPYFSRNIQEFWQRWHRTLSLWFRDYIYIPLGGSRKGSLRKWCNLFLVFLVSGMWHGCGLKYILWGLLHGFYQLVGGTTRDLRNRAYGALHLDIHSGPVTFLRRGITFLLVTLGWIVFRANTLGDVLSIVTAPAAVWSPAALLAFRPGTIGLSGGDCLILILALGILYTVDRAAFLEKPGLSDRILSRPFPLRLALYLGVIFFILIFGSYGYGFAPQDFIYGGF